MGGSCLPGVYVLGGRQVESAERVDDTVNYSYGNDYAKKLPTTLPSASEQAPRATFSFPSLKLPFTFFKVFLQIPVYSPPTTTIKTPSMTL